MVTWSAKWRLAPLWLAAWALFEIWYHIILLYFTYIITGIAHNIWHVIHRLRQHFAEKILLMSNKENAAKKSYLHSWKQCRPTINNNCKTEQYDHTLILYLLLCTFIYLFKLHLHVGYNEYATDYNFNNYQCLWTDM